MKKSIQILLFIFVGLYLKAQDCDYKVNAKDEFTGTTSLMTASEIVKKSGKYVYLELLKTDGKYYLTMNYTEGALSINSWTCDENDPLIFVFEDGSTLNLEPKDNMYMTQPKRMDRWAAAFIGSLSVFADKAIFAPQYQIDKKGLSELIKKSVKKFRITAKGKSGNTLEKLNNIEFEVGEKEANLIKKDAACIIMGDNEMDKNAVPENLPIDEQTKKITFEDKIVVDSVSKEKLYDRAKNWLISYTKNNQFISENKDDGILTKSVSFTKQFKYDGAQSYESDEFAFDMTIFVKDNKYKYNITNLSISDGRQKMELEPIFDLYKKRPSLLETVKEKTYEGVMEVIRILQTSMTTEEYEIKV